MLLAFHLLFNELFIETKGGDFLLRSAKLPKTKKKGNAFHDAQILLFSVLDLHMLTSVQFAI